MWPSLNETEKEMDADDDLFEGVLRGVYITFFAALDFNWR